MWHEAKTYSKIAPHEYIVQEEHPDVYDKYKELIERYGQEEEFTLLGNTSIYKYYYSKDHKYWVMDNILNRAELGLKK